MPVPLRWLVAAVLLAGVSWALLVPPWQAPDEDAHFAYVQTIAELGRLPRDDGRRALDAAKSTEQDLAELASGYRDSGQRIEMRPQWDPRAFARWKADAGRAPRLGTQGRRRRRPRRRQPAGLLPLRRHPVPGRALGRDLRPALPHAVWSVLLLGLLVVSGWLLAGELVGRDRTAQLLAGAVCGLAPMATFVSATVSPDALIYPLWGFAFWLCARIVRRGAARREVVALVLVVLCALVVKPVSVALLPGVLWALAWRRIPLRAVAAVVGLTVVVATVVVPGGPRRFLSYLWQFYVPFDAGTNVLPQLAPWPLRDTWLEGTVGAFGWLEVRLPVVVLRRGGGGHRRRGRRRPA